MIQPKVDPTFEAVATEMNKSFQVLEMTRLEALDMAISMLDLIEMAGAPNPLTQEAFDQRLMSIKAARKKNPNKFTDYSKDPTGGKLGKAKS